MSVIETERAVTRRELEGEEEACGRREGGRHDREYGPGLGGRWPPTLSGRRGSDPFHRTFVSFTFALNNYRKNIYFPSILLSADSQQVILPRNSYLCISYLCILPSVWRGQVCFCYCIWSLSSTEKRKERAASAS